RVPAEEIERRDVAFRRAERGGRATYHGPGQLVGYLIGGLRSLAPDVCSYVCRLEDVLLRTASSLQVDGSRRDGQPGVWVGDAKLGSIGVAISRGICWHGFALNLDPELAAFDLIRPCGFDLPVTSIAALGGRNIGVEECAALAARTVAEVFALKLD